MKAITMYRPNTLENALSDFDRYFENFFGDSILTSAKKGFSRLPAVDIRETEKEYFLEMELAGFDEKNIGVHLDGGILTISSKEEETSEEKKEQTDSKTSGEYILRERRSCGFSRSFKLPDNTDPESVSASFKNGVLSLEIKKRPEAQKRSIRINAA
ncbi:MAG TPA: molecular chaperone Hsp20 [Treponema sp.]|nr:molecular chaperone Hsp20 [Treponema sp.]